MDLIVLEAIIINEKRNLEPSQKKVIMAI